MNDMIVIDNEIVPVYQTDTGEKVVYGSELHKVLGSPSTYREWSKRRLSDIDAVEKNDFEGVEISTPSGQTKKDHIIKLDSAKEMAMLERNEIGKKVRKHFIEIENRYKQQIIDRTQLSPQTQLILSMSESIAKTELEQKRQAEVLQRLEDKTNKQSEALQTVKLSPQTQLILSMSESIAKTELEQKRQAEVLQRLEDKTNKQSEALQTVKDTFTKSETEEETVQWVNHCINKIAESPNFVYSFGNRYAAAKNESYNRLSTKAGCRLDQKLRNSIARAEERGYTRAQINTINKLSVIMADKRLKQIYIGVIKEMMIAYCVEIA